MVFNLLEHPLILFPTISLVVYAIFKAATAKSTIPSQLPWIGAQEGSFSQWKGKWHAISNTTQLLSDGYRKYSRFGKYFILPVPFARSEVVIPQSHASWLLNQPDKILSSEEVHKDLIQPEWAFLNFRAGKRLSHETIIRRDLTRQLGNLTEDIMEELTAGFDKYWGTDTNEFKEVSVYQTIRKIIARTSNRIFVGLPLCRNDEYIDNVMALSQDVIPSSQMIRLFPWFLKPLAARLVTIPNRIHRARALKHALPVVKQRLAELDRVATDPEFAKSYKTPNDFLTWTIQDARRRNDLEDLDPEVIAVRVLIANFVAIETSTASTVEVIYDLVSANPNFLSGIQEEATRIVTENGGKWTKAGLASMIRADSAIKETLRLNLTTKALTKEVTPAEGITLEDGLHLPQGARMTVSAYGIHRDPNIYPNGETYDPFRFSRAREELEAKLRAQPQSPVTSNGDIEKPPQSPVDTSRIANLVKEKNFSVVSTSESFLAFGHSRHACPGRFFAANEIKLLLAYMAMNYDIKPLETRPEGMFIAEFKVPNMSAKISARRKAVPV